jgi:hypothetical protein
VGTLSQILPDKTQKKDVIMSDPIFLKTYVSPDNTAELTCPHCGRQKTLLVNSFKGYKHKLKVKCGCQNVFTVILEYRDNIRRNTYLKGTYVNHSQGGRSGDFTTRDISVTGFAFSCLDIKSFKEGDKISVEFTLDNTHQTEIRKKAIVKNVRQRAIGCEFEKTEEASDNLLEHYVNMKL